jgi:hypothetical protein
MHNLSSVYFVNQPVHVSGIFVAHHQEVYCIYTNGTCCVFSWLSVGLVCQTVEVDWWNKLRINSSSNWFSLHRCIEMHGQQNIKKNCDTHFVLENVH